MPRKHCPQCKLVTGASTETCSRCGHVFERMAVPVSAGVRRCLECGLTSPATARRCQCGAELDIEPADLRGLLAERRGAGRSMIAAAIAVGVFAVGAFAAIAMVSGLVAVGGIGVTIAFSARTYRKGRRILDAAHVMTAELAAREAALPEARIHR
jgi:hypothetical protein